MEEKRANLKENTQNNLKKTEEKSKVKDLKSKDKLTFKKSSAQKKSFRIDPDVSSPWGFSKDRTNIILAINISEFKIYQIKENSIKFASDHKIEVPIDANIFSSKVCRRSIRLVLDKKRLKKTQKKINF